MLCIWVRGNKNRGKEDTAKKENITNYHKILKRKKERDFFYVMI